MRSLRLFALLTLLTWTTFSVGGRAAQTLPVVQGVRAYLFDEMTGSLEEEDFVGSNYVPRNRLGTGFLSVITVDLGKDCVMPSLSPQQAGAVARGDGPAPLRPKHCETPSGSLQVNIKHAGFSERRRIALAQFASGDDGKIRVPMFFYRKDPCEPLEIRATVVGSGRTVTKAAKFSCGE